MLQIHTADTTVMIRDEEIRQSLPPADIIHLAKEQFARHMRLEGTHGTKHWSRVLENGLLLARLTGADPRLVAYFATLHDCQRWDEYRDEFHGQRAADFAGKLEARLGLTRSELQLLQRAMRGHSMPSLEDRDITVQTCWDADRLDLWRIGIQPDPKRLCTAPARRSEVIWWAYEHLDTMHNWYHQTE
jgi:uncharacterized protein